MNPKEISQSDKQELHPLPANVEGEIHILLQYRSHLPARSRRERKELLKQLFESVQEEVGDPTLALDFSSISSVGQSIEGRLPIRNAEAVQEAARKHRISVTPVVDAKLV